MDAIKELDTVKVGVPLMGDLILIRSKGWMAEINCGVQTRFSDVKAQFSHVGLWVGYVILSLPKRGVTGDTFKKAIEGAEEYYVIRHIDVDETIYKKGGKYGVLGDQGQEEVRTALLYYLKQEYNWKVFMPSENTSLCSELVIKAYKRAKIELNVEENVKVPWPVHIQESIEENSSMWRNATEAYRNVVEAKDGWNESQEGLILLDQRQRRDSIRLMVVESCLTDLLEPTAESQRVEGSNSQNTQLSLIYRYHDSADIANSILRGVYKKKRVKGSKIKFK